MEVIPSNTCSDFFDGQIPDVNVQTDAERNRNSYLTETFAKVIDLLDGAGSGMCTRSHH